MGCDIHSIGQIYKDNKWQTVVARPGDDDRNYDSFAVMANVRNGYGFAGCKTGMGWPFIAEPRGLPKDVKLDIDDYVDCPAYKNEWMDKPETKVWLGDHSHSFLSLQEMIYFSENVLLEMNYERHGFVQYETWKKIHDKKLDEPDMWCGGTSASSITQREAESGKKADYVEMSWTVKAKECLHTFNRYIDELKKIAEVNNLSPNDVRLVFGFDS